MFGCFALGPLYFKWFS